MNREKKIILSFSFIVIILLGLIFFLVLNKNKQINTNLTWAIETNSWSEEKKELVITLITDKRNKNTSLDSFMENLKVQEPSLAEAKIKNLDFSDDSVKNFLKKNNISTLPAIIFSTDDFETENSWTTDLKKYLTKLESGDFFLEIWANYNPFSATQRWISTIEKNIITEIKDNSYFQNDKNKKIIWLEFSDLSCEFCKNFNNSWIIDEVLKQKEISKTYNHFVVHEGKHFEFLECFAEQKWEKEFFNFLKKSFENWTYEESELLTLSKNFSINEENLKTCISSEKYKEKIEKQKSMAQNIFWVNATPTSVFINSETWEYKIISWFDKESWVKPYLEIIDSLN